jgi:hypothetical protein
MTAVERHETSGFRIANTRLLLVQSRERIGNRALLQKTKA